MNSGLGNEGIVPVASRDQHILVDEKVLNAVVEAARLTKEDTVLEIGGGPGNLTEKIAARAGKVIVVEMDGRYAKILKKKFRSGGNTSIVHGNVLDIRLPCFNKIVSNMPYSISEPFFLKLIKERKHNFDMAVMTLSDSFVQKMTVPVSSPLFGLVSALFSSFFVVEVFAKVPRESFSPPPRTLSHCIRIMPKASVPQKDRIGFIMQRIFLCDTKKIKNVLLETLWNYGRELVGRKLTKKESTSLIREIFGSGFGQILCKRVANLSNGDFQKIASSLLQWDSRMRA